MPRTYVAPPTGPHKAFALRFRAACESARLPTTLKGLAKVFCVAAPTVHDWRHGEKLPLELAARIDRAPADVQDYIRAILTASEHHHQPPA